ncbi:MAG: hypothetical protein ACQEVT_08070 [Pseudomonadota bacterium]|uniref:hypothetical protein n=1 Tax=Roseovarius TaxID=74030 RepID=UPI0022A88DD3|nr:hypothetical protein [Roseovarius sp. EGI FJ00037]MCZ0812681.1 hypothetical protein [Roseovarius sp. EGI FJ00037]
MTKFFKTFASNTEGAVTVDWVVLTATVVGLGVGVVAVLLNGNSALGEKLSDSMANAEVRQLVLD